MDHEIFDRELMYEKQNEEIRQYPGAIRADLANLQELSDQLVLKPNIPVSINMIGNSREIIESLFAAASIHLSPEARKRNRQIMEALREKTKKIVAILQSDNFSNPKKRQWLEHFTPILSSLDEISDSLASENAPAFSSMEEAMHLKDDSTETKNLLQHILQKSGLQKKR